MNQYNFSRPLIIATVFLLILNACGTTAPAPDANLSTQQLAERAYASGNYSRAAEYYQQASSIASDDAIDSLRVKTADAWLRSQRPNRAAELLSQVNEVALPRQDLALFYIAHADLALQQNDPIKGDFYLQAAKQGLPSSLNERYTELQQKRINMQRDPSDRSLLEVAELSAGMNGYDPDLALEILRSLESVSSAQLSTLIERQQYDPEFTEWLELALQIRVLVISNTSVTQSAQYWSSYHYGHAVDQANYAELVASYSALFPVPAKVAVLLPTEGGLSAAASAIRDGILSAYFDQPGDAELQFYSSGENSESAIAAFEQAREDGAMQVVGPLRIDSTRRLANLDGLSTSVLLLNDPQLEDPQGTDRTGMINSLLLSQTEEATAIADMALAQGYKRVLMIIPDNAWGLRVGTAFSTVFEQGEGQVAAISRYGTANDLDTMLMQLLRIDESKQRKADLRQWLGIPLNFEAQRRDDFDFIFMAARPAQGRELKPLLRFHDAGDIPVYAMGRIYSGRLAPAQDQDLDGIVFATTHGQLRAVEDELKLPASVRDGDFGNFYALGQDAWRLLPWLPLMQKDPDLWFPGNIGPLRMQPNGNLFREPVWAQFSGGKPMLYQWPDS